MKEGREPGVGLGEFPADALGLIHLMKEGDRRLPGYMRQDQGLHTPGPKAGQGSNQSSFLHRKIQPHQSLWKRAQILVSVERCKGTKRGYGLIFPAPRRCATVNLL